ncbi:hypothetical protein NXS98_08355 [Fontisphaera persica]|nr:hypothetical protein [Fontisphaera persica]WCJ61119.1 hypothetical protein NXS98_08355 [Fontisphaera persica]
MSTTTPEPPTRQNFAKRKTSAFVPGRNPWENTSCRLIFAALIFAALIFAALIFAALIFAALTGNLLKNPPTTPARLLGCCA